MAVFGDSDISLSAVHPGLLSGLASADPQAIAGVSKFMKSTQIPNRHIMPVWHALVEGLINASGNRNATASLSALKDDSIAPSTIDPIIFGVYDGLANLAINAQFDLDKRNAEIAKINAGLRLVRRKELSLLPDSQRPRNVVIHVGANLSKISLGRIAVPEMDKEAFMALAEKVLFYALDKGTPETQLAVVSAMAHLETRTANDRLKAIYLEPAMFPTELVRQANASFNIVRGRRSLRKARENHARLREEYPDRDSAQYRVLEILYSAIDKVLISNWAVPHDLERDVALRNLTAFSVMCEKISIRETDAKNREFFGRIQQNTDLENAFLYVFENASHDHLRKQAGAGFEALHSQRVYGILTHMANEKPDPEMRLAAQNILSQKNPATASVPKRLASRP